MKEILDVQKQSFIENGPPSHKQRITALEDVPLLKRMK